VRSFVILALALNLHHHIWRPLFVEEILLLVGRLVFFLSLSCVGRNTTESVFSCYSSLLIAL